MAEEVLLEGVFMSLPKYSEFYIPILELLQDGNIHSTTEIKNYCIDVMNLSEEEKNTVFSNGKKVLPNRVGWALSYLRKAKLIHSPKHSQNQLTEEGMKLVNEDLYQVEAQYMKRFDSFQEEQTDTAGTDIGEGMSPSEVIDCAKKEIDCVLRDELMTQLVNVTPYRFEEIVMDVLEKMGYGNIERNVVTKKSNDEGIDGIVTEDQLGFDKIYVQAKKWSEDNLVSRGEVQKFSGAIAGQGGTKGVFITTSDFTKGAKEYVEKQFNQKIILVNGQKLMKYMIEYNVGVSVENVVEIKRINLDYFNNEI